MKTNSKKQIILPIIESMIGNLQKNEELINDLNVFPVPDGDTGSNMLATLLMAWDYIQEESNTDIKILEDFSRGALLGARGNSGVITSQIFKGVFKGAESLDSFSFKTAEVRKILSSAKKYAYNAVQIPVEGTILSVVRAMDKQYNREADSIIQVFEELASVAKAATMNTPNQLAILKESGVVDSGAYGLQILIEGALAALKGNPIKIRIENQSNTHTPKPRAEFIKADPLKNIGYCTEFILTLKNPKKFNKKEFVETLKKIGDSIVVIKENDLLKVHIHVKNPGIVFNEAQKHGEFSTIKSENMASQTANSPHIIESTKRKKKPNLLRIKKVAQKLAIVVVSDGVGLDEEFKSLGATHIVSGGQSMNPSVKEFIKIINSISNKDILILPNNSNIILTAEQVKKTIKEKSISVLPTKTLTQGILALSNINDSMVDFNEFKDDILEEIKVINEAQISRASRATEMHGIKIEKNNFIAIKNKKIVNCEKTLINSFKKLLEVMIVDDTEILNIIYNDEVNFSVIKEIKEIVSKKYKEIDIELKYGGQKVYNLLLFGE